jgi:hypothetical protein
MANSDKKITITYALGLVLFLGAIYTIFSYGSHRYCMIHEGFVSRAGERKIKDSKKADLTEGQIKAKAEQIQKLLDEVYEELNFDKDIDDYENLVGDLRDLVDANILNSIIKNKDGLTANLADPQSMASIKDINELGRFQEVLRNMKPFLDKN